MVLNQHKFQPLHQHVCCCSVWDCGSCIRGAEPAQVSAIASACVLLLCVQVPFIAFYRKEYVEPELNIKDLWKVWQFDEKVSSLSPSLFPSPLSPSLPLSLSLSFRLFPPSLPPSLSPPLGFPRSISPPLSPPLL